MYTWIVIIMAILQVQYRYLESKMVMLIKKSVNKNGQAKKKYIAEFKNLAVICLFTAVNGPAIRGTFKRGTKGTVVTNADFYGTLLAFVGDSAIRQFFRKKYSRKFQ